MRYLFLCAVVALSLSVPFSSAYAGSVQVSVNGLVCDFCARALEKVFGREDAVEDIDVNLDEKVITITFKQGQNLDNETIAKLIVDLGYNVESIDRDLSVDDTANEAESAVGDSSAQE